MLVELEIENLALVERARIPFQPGLNALTGATGAGKTLVLRALDLVRGGRVDKERLGGSGECRIAALFRVAPELANSLAEGADSADGDFLLARTIGPDGRSRCSINGRLASLAELRGLGERLVEVLGQGETARLNDADERALLLDRFSGAGAAFERYRTARAAAVAARERRDSLCARGAERRRALEFARFQIAEIDGVALRPGELAELDAEAALLGAAEELRQTCGTALDDLYDAEGSAVERIGSHARRARALPEAARGLLLPAAEALERSRRELEDAVAEFRALLARAEADPARAAAVDARLDQVHRLLARFGPAEDQLFALRERLGAEVQQLLADEQDTEGADAAVAAADRELEAAAEALERARAKGAGGLAKRVGAALGKLDLGEARFRVALEAFPGASVFERARATGTAAVEFLLAANPGHPERPLHAVASGGEAARISLALHCALADVAATPVLVFDEIESGVGARLGSVVAAALREVAAGRQVLVVTHLPQVAAAAAHHVRAAKHSAGGRTRTSFEVLAGAERRAELAAMADGPKAARASGDGA